jgi:hypothetical protein
MTGNTCEKIYRLYTASFIIAFAPDVTKCAEKLYFIVLHSEQGEVSLSVSYCWRCLNVKERKEGRGKGISVGRTCRMNLKVRVKR